MNARLNIFMAIILAGCLLLPACQPSSVQTTESVQPTPADPVMEPATVAVPSTAVPEATPIVHTNRPGEPAYLDNQVVEDCPTGVNFVSGKQLQIPSYCDLWRINLLERPMTSDGMGLSPFLDVEFAQLGYQNGWYYARLKIFQEGRPQDGSSVYYLFELDLDGDGRGEVMLSVKDLPVDATEWTVAGVQVWRDGNGDVGAQLPVKPDTAATGDGYETLVFDQGIGADPDLAWARRSPTSPRRIEFGFKPELIENSTVFVWLGWALAGDLNPATFDLVDTQSETGLYQVDNTCSWSFGGTISGLPNRCLVIVPTPVPGAAPFVCVKPPKPYEDPCWIWFQDKCQWICYN